MILYSHLGILRATKDSPMPKRNAMIRTCRGQLLQRLLKGMWKKMWKFPRASIGIYYRALAVEIAEGCCGFGSAVTPITAEFSNNIKES